MRSELINVDQLAGGASGQDGWYVAVAREAVQVESCAGSTATARLAQKVAAGVEQLAELPSAGTDVIVIDGCSSACARRRLEGRGLRTAAINLQQLGVDHASASGPVDTDRLTARAVERLRRLEQTSSRSGHARRPASDRPSGSQQGGRVHSGDDYLFALYTLTSPVVSCGTRSTEVPTLAAHVARVLGVSRASAGEMLERLAAEGLIEHGPRKEILLADAGHDAAAQIVRRHRLVERHLVDALAYPVAESYGAALQIRSACDDTLIERIAAQLSPPMRCPHGWPVDLAEEQELLSQLVTLAALAHGERATVVALLEDDATTLTRLDELGVLPGIEVRALDGDAESVVIEAGDRRRVLDRDASVSVFVRPL